MASRSPTRTIAAIFEKHSTQKSSTSKCAIPNFQKLTDHDHHSYYDATTDIYLESWGESFHLCRFPRGPEKKALAMARHEHHIAAMTGIRPGMKVLDVGCGVGGPAREIAAFGNCHVVGLNNNPYQVKKGMELCEKYKMSNMVEFEVGDFMVSLFSLRVSGGTVAWSNSGGAGRKAST